MAAIAFSDLCDAIDGELQYDAITRALYATDASIYRILPAAVAFPRHSGDVSQIVQFATRAGLSVVPRGGGSGLAGEAIGPGIVIDFSRFMKDCLRIDPVAKTVRVQAGMVLSELNHALANHGLMFGPDPASTDRCTLGGMIANNSTGAHSIKYGCTRDHLVSLTVVLADGSVVEVGEGLPIPESLRELDIALRERLTHDIALIDKHTPQVGRNRSGYLLSGVLHNDKIDYPKLLAASEGTLALLCEATLRVVAIPKYKGLAVVGFDSLDNAARAVVELLNDNPSTLELLDDTVIDIGIDLQSRFADLIPAGASYALVVEHDAADRDSLKQKLDQTAERARSEAACSIGSVMVDDPSDQSLIWATRNEAEPLLYRHHWPRQPISFVEDVAVDPKRLPDYLKQQAAIFADFGVEAACYAHAGHGELHVKPYLNLHQSEDRIKMRAISERVHALAISMGGTISGEHGEGLLRAQFIKQQHGALYDTFVAIKRLFDPKGILNPNKKITDDPDLLSKNLRAQNAIKYRPNRLRYEKDSIDKIVDQCNGCAACRTVETKVSMCPIFKAVPEEPASPRAKANLMRELMTGHLDPMVVRSQGFKELAHLCINCKMCLLECPSGVDIPKLMLDAKAMHVEQMGLTLSERLLVHTETFAKATAWMAPLMNGAGRIPLLRALGEKVIGIDRRRVLPPFHWRPFLSRRRHGARFTGGRKVVYFVDLYANHNDPELANDLVDVLEHNGVTVAIPSGQVGCGMPAIDNGDLPTARAAVAKNLNALAEYLEEGYTIVSAEPTATLTLREEYQALTDDPRADALSEAAVDVCDYLWQMHQAGELRTDFRNVPIRLGYHAPCHLKALEIGRPGMALARLVPGATVTEIDEGCCGIAGTYGFKTSGFDNSMTIGKQLFAALAEPTISAGLTECSTCKMQMEQGSHKRTVHPITLLAAAYGFRELPA